MTDVYMILRAKQCERHVRLRSVLTNLSHSLASPQDVRRSTSCASIMEFHTRTPVPGALSVTAQLSNVQLCLALVCNLSSLS